MSLQKLHPRLQDFVKDNKWSDLTPIQKKAFDPIYGGVSCIIEAPTSGGKTEAVLFPLLTRISENKSHGFKILYVAPLKALLNDLALRVVPYAKMCSKEAFKWHGDVSQQEKVEQMLFPSDILLTTPESIEAILLRKSNWREVFGSVETIVIDEAHYFAMTERGSHLVCLLERICEGIKKDPQRVAVTATVGNPEELLNWLMGQGRKGVAIKTDSLVEKEKDFKINYFTDDGKDLYLSLYNLLVNKKSIVFERSRSNTEETAAKINELNQQLKTRIPIIVKTHHSSVSKHWREEAESEIKRRTESSLNAIISTSTLELGIDIGELDQVIQVGALNSSGSFLQRVGRTGRRKDRPQYFRGLCADSDDLILLTGCVSLGLKRVSENILFPKKAFHILAHQIVCLTLQNGGISPDQIWKILSKAACFAKITRKELDLLIAHMLQEDYLRKVDGNILLTSDKTETEFLRANWKRLFAIFDSGPMYNVVDGKRVIGTLDSGFAREQELPFIFVLGGQEWNAKKIDHEMQQVLVTKNETGKAPKWKAFGAFDIPFELAQEVGRLLMNNETLEVLDREANLIFKAECITYELLAWQAGKWVIQPHDDNGGAILWTFAGDKINRTISMLLESYLECKTEYDYKNISIKSNKRDTDTIRDVRELITLLRTKTCESLEQDVEKKIKPRWFSKFSECIPESIAKKTIREKGMDVAGLKREIEGIAI